MLRNFILRLRRDERGATLVEYGVALLVVSVVGGASILAVAEDTGTMFTEAKTATAAAVGDTPNGTASAK